MHKESAAPAQIFSALYLSKSSAGRGGGGGSGSRLLCSQQLTCASGGPAAGRDGDDAACNEPAAHCSVHGEGRGGGFQIQLWASIRASILLSKSSTELRAQACQGRTVQQRGWGDPTRDQKLCAGEIPPSLTIPPPPSSFYHIFSILLRMAAIPQQPHRVCRAAAPPRRKAHGRGIHHFFSMPFPSDQAAYESCL